jgi:hypothetical protein
MGATLIRQGEPTGMGESVKTDIDMPPFSLKVAKPKFKGARFCAKRPIASFALANRRVIMLHPKFCEQHTAHADTSLKG